MKYLVLSSYPGKGSKNSGDHLLTESLVNILHNIKGDNIKVDIVSAVDDIPSDIEDFSQYTAILAPALRPTIKGDQVAPKNRVLFLKEAHKYKIPVFGVGSGWKAYPGTVEQATDLKLDSEEIKLLENIFGRKNDKGSLGMISTRDITTEALLLNNNINCYGTTGDCGLFDPVLIQTPFKLPNKIKKIAVSMPHNDNHKEMAYNTAVKLKEEYNCEVTITFHGYHTTFEEEIHDNWDTNLINIVDLAGGSGNLSFYDDVDLHVGFRLHAHIWFLRTRKPSLLLGEDGRGMGHLYTVNGLGYSAATSLALKTAKLFPKWKRNPLYKVESKKEPQDLIIEMLRDEIESGYQITKETLNQVDTLWNEKMKPFIELIP